MLTETLHHAYVLWSYFESVRSVEKSDVIVVCCSYDLRVCDYACELLTDGLAERIIFSGKQGRWTSMIWDKSESDIFYDHAINKGIDKDRLFKESTATNIGENIACSKLLIQDAQKVIFLSKPNTILRVKLTVPVHWADVQYCVSCPDIQFPDEISNIVGVFGLISEMVGDVERIIEYPRQGYQVSHKLPEEVLVSYNYLKEKGFVHCL